MEQTQSQKPLRWGIIGGGLMGRELASAFGRWFALNDPKIPPAQLVAVCDTQESARNWFARVPGVELLTGDRNELLSADLDAVYVAVPHQLHRELYLEVLRAGKDLLAEKPFGIDLEAAREVRDEAAELGRFVRVSSELPFLPGAFRVFQMLQDLDSFGHLIEVRAGFWHSSDLDGQKPANWKRQNAFCGVPGVMNDLGMHVVHLPLRLGWQPKRVYAQLQKIFETRPDGRGGTAVCDTWDNASLHTEIELQGREIPMRLEMKRLAPGQTNTWFLEVLGTDGGAKFSTHHPKTVWTFERGKDQWWKETDLGHQTPFPTVTGGIFEAGFPDAILQMLASFGAERAGILDGRLGCATPDEAVQSHELWQAALQSHETKAAVEL